jgi:hypothetical protein
MLQVIEQLNLDRNRLIRVMKRLVGELCEGGLAEELDRRRLAGIKATREAIVRFLPDEQALPDLDAELAPLLVSPRMQGGGIGEARDKERLRAQALLGNPVGMERALVHLQTLPAQEQHEKFRELAAALTEVISGQKNYREIGEQALMANTALVIEALMEAGGRDLAIGRRQLNLARGLSAAAANRLPLPLRERVAYQWLDTRPNIAQRFHAARTYAADPDLNLNYVELADAAALGAALAEADRSARGSEVRLHLANRVADLLLLPLGRERLAAERNSLRAPMLLIYRAIDDVPPGTPEADRCRARLGLGLLKAENLLPYERQITATAIVQRPRTLELFLQLTVESAEPASERRMLHHLIPGQQANAQFLRSWWLEGEMNDEAIESFRRLWADSTAKLQQAVSRHPQDISLQRAMARLVPPQFGL